jgi:8-oxo-dGTP diphosphatase
VGVLVLRGQRVLLGQRRGAHGAHTWALPGGHLEFGESVADCARREVAEETGLLLGEIAPGPFTNDVFAAEGLHYVTLFVQAHCDTGQAQVLEPHKCAAWAWFDWHALPQPLFAPLQSLVDSGFDPTAGPAGS